MLGMRLASTSLLVLTAVSVSVFAIPSAQATYPGKNGKILYDCETGLCTMDQAGSGRANVINDTTVCCGSWSADGRQFAYRQTVELPGGVSDGIIKIARSNGSSAKTVVQGHGTGKYGTTAYQEPSLSPDGKKIVFSDGHGLLVVNSNGLGEKRLTNQEDFSPHWSPSGRQIAFLRGSNIDIMNADGAGEPQKITRLAKEHFATDSSSWSPDGSRIAYISESYSGDRELQIVDLQTLNQTAITAYKHTSTPVWSPDGKQIAYSVTVSSSSEEESSVNAIYRVALDGGGPIKLIQGQFLDRPDWGVATPGCVVPKLKGLTVKKARRLLKRGNCRLGKRSFRSSSRVKRGRVIKQSPKAGKRTKVGKKVKLIISKG